VLDDHDSDVLRKHKYKCNGTQAQVDRSDIVMTDILPGRETEKLASIMDSSLSIRVLRRYGPLVPQLLIAATRARCLCASQTIMCRDYGNSSE